MRFAQRNPFSAPGGHIVPSEMEAPYARKRPSNRRQRRAARNRGSAPLAWYTRRRTRHGGRLLRAELVQAGEQLARDFHLGQLMPRVTMDWSTVKVDGGDRRGLPSERREGGEIAVSAQRRVLRALNAVGSELSGLLIDVCCFEKGVETTEAAEGWPQRAGKVVLEIALTRLARHYGFLAAPSPHACLRHWGETDYRPTLEKWRDPAPAATTDRKKTA